MPALFYGNNIQNCSRYSLTLETSENVIAANNYWGTTDKAVIENSIYDHNDDSSLGTVDISPFLTKPNSQAQPLKNEMEHPALITEVFWIFLALITIIILILAIVFMKGKQRKK